MGRTLGRQETGNSRISLSKDHACQWCITDKSNKNKTKFYN